jgi:hypothetical protein
MRDRPFEAVKSAMVSKFYGVYIYMLMGWIQRNGTAAPSIAATLIDALPEGQGRADAEILARNTTAVAYSGGSDTVRILKCCCL